MKKNWRKPLLFLSVVLILLVILGLNLSTVLPAVSISSTRLPFDKPSASPQPKDQWDADDDRDEDSLFRTFSRSTTGKKEDYRPEQSLSSNDQMSHLRYIILGNLEPDLALIVKLVDKAKTGRISARSLADYLRWRQRRLGQGSAIETKVKQLVLELSIFEIGQTSWRELTQFLAKIKTSGLGFSYGSDSFSFNQIVELTESQILTPREAIDTLIMFQYSDRR